MESSRQIPKDKAILKNKMYCDILYAYLQVISHQDGVIGHPRFIFKKDANFSKIGADLNISRQTVSKKFAKLQELQLVSELNEGGVYELVVLPGDLAQLVPLRTLRILTNTLNENCISIYVYLLGRYMASGNQGFQITYEQLKGVIGISTTTRSNSYIIQDILTVLSSLGLIDIRKVYETDKQGLKTNCYIGAVFLQIKDVSRIEQRF